MKQHRDVQNAINQFKAGMIVDVLDVEEITIEEPGFYQPEDIESQRCMNLAETQPFVDLARSYLFNDIKG